jgi:hypothetical protein
MSPNAPIAESGICLIAMTVVSPFSGLPVEPLAVAPEEVTE